MDGIPTDDPNTGVVTSGPDTTSLQVGELQRRAITGSVWTVIHVLIYVPTAFVANAVVAHSLGVSRYGHLAFLTAALGLALLFADFGFTSAAIQKGSRAEAGGRRNEADGLLRRSLGFQAIVEFPITVAVAIWLTRSSSWWEVVTLLVAVFLTRVLSGATLSITIENRTAVAARLAIGVNLVVQCATVTTALLSGSPSAVLVVRTLVAGIGLAPTFLLLDPARRKAALRPRLPRGMGGPFWRFALLNWAAGLAALLVFQRSEIFILEAFHQARALGLYSLAFGLGQQITAPVDALLLPLLPAVAGILSEWPAHAYGAFARSTRVSALLCGGIAAAVTPLLVFGVPVIYGHAFGSAAWLFFPLALVSIFQSVNNPVLAFVNARQRGGLRLKANAVALLVDAAIAVALIPEFGAWGAVAAAVLGQLVALVWLVLAEPLVRMSPLREVLRLYRPFLAGLAVAAIVLPLGVELRHLSALLASLGAGSLGIVLYVLTIRITRSGLTAEDVDALVQAVAAPFQRWLSGLLRTVTSTAQR